MQPLLLVAQQPERAFHGDALEADFVARAQLAEPPKIGGDHVGRLGIPARGGAPPRARLPGCRARSGLRRAGATGRAAKNRRRSRWPAWDTRRWSGVPQIGRASCRESVKISVV